jgi:3-hydroxyisobutyrate dehydrogenase-like beta-hydroxyacid dehydrogenase
VGLKLPIGSHIQDLYRQAIDQGYGRQDLIGWYELIEKGIFDD